MFKKMSYPSKEQEDRTIKNLEKRICDLENPYKFNIGDKVHLILYDNTNDFGTVVEQLHSYNDISLLFTFNYCYRPAEYERKNSYKIYSEQSKKTYHLDESQINLYKKK